MHISQTLIGILAMAATAFLWSIAGLFIKAIDWNPITIAGTRSLIASLVLFIYLRKPHFHFSFPQVAAAICNAGTMLLFISANKATTAANAILLQYMAPVITAFLAAIILKEHTRKEHWISFTAVAMGMIIMFMDDLTPGKLTGNIMAVGSAFTFSLFFIFMRMQKDGSPFESILLSHLITAAVCFVVSIFLPLPVITFKSAGAIAVLGIIQVGFSAVLFSAAIKRITAVSANLIAVIEPVFSPIWVFIVLGETPGVKTIFGGTIIITAVTFVSIISGMIRGRNKE